MKLTTTNDKIQVVLGGSVTTNQLQCLCTGPTLGVVANFKAQMLNLKQMMI